MNQTPKRPRAHSGQQTAGPGAMTMAMQAASPIRLGPKVLRIGIIRNENIVEDRVISRRETIYVGTSEKNHFVIKSSDLESQVALFQLSGDDYILNFSDSMQGRVGLAGGVQELTALRSSGGARKSGKYSQVKLSDTSRGKIIIGDTTILFQFVDPPAAVIPPQLSAAASGGFVRSIDWSFSAFVVFFYLLFFGGIIYLENYDYPIDQGIEEISESYARLIFQEEPPPEPEEEPSDEGEKEAEDKTDKADSRKADKQPKADSSPSDSASEGPSAEDLAQSAEARARLAEEVAAQAEAMLQGSLAGLGNLDDVLGGGAVTDDAASVLAQASGVGVAAAGTGSLRAKSGGGTGSTGSLGSLKRAGGADATSARKEGGALTERAVKGKISLKGGGDIGGTGEFDSSSVVRAIKARLRAIKSCYENQLKSNPSLAGKVAVSFTIQQSGSVTGVKATENTSGSSALATCIVSKVRTLRFNPGPTGGSVTYSYPFVFAPQN